MSSMHGTDTAWSVQAHANHSHPIDCGDGLLLGQEWVQVPFVKGNFGVPVTSISRTGELLGLMDYEAAQALRWWFVAAMKAKWKHGIETRLVMHKITYSIKSEEAGAEEALDDIAYLRAGKAIDTAIATQEGGR